MKSQDDGRLSGAQDHKSLPLGRVSAWYAIMVGDARLERATFGSGDQRSIHLS